MFPELPLARQLECELKVRAIKEKGLQEPESLLNYTLSLIRRNYNLEHSVLTALARIGELQVELALAANPAGPAPIAQRHFDMVEEVLSRATEPPGGAA
jgi:hypothetical protein